MIESGSRKAFAYALLLVGLFWIYRDGIADIPRGDELGYLREKDIVAPGAPWFWHVVSFTRTRLLSGENHVMFRPLFGAYTALTMASEPGRWSVARGVLGILLHFAAVLALVRLVAIRYPRGTALLVALPFAAQYSGLEMVVWQHIHGYLLGLVLFLAGLVCLVTARHAWATIAFSASALAYECALGPLFALVLIGGFRRRLREVLTGVVPIALFLALDLWDLHRHPMLLVADPYAERAAGAVARFPGLLADLLGVSAVAWLAPWHVDLRYVHIWDRATWDFTSLPERWYLALGAIVLLGVAGTMARAASAIVRRRDGPAETAILLVGVYLLTVAGVFTWFRTLTRGFLPYLGVSTYYYYVFSVCFWILAALSVRISRATIVALVLVEVVPSVVLIQRVLDDRRPGVALVRETNLEIQERIPPNGCYAGSVADVARRFDPPAAPTVLTGSTSCASVGRRGRTPWVLAQRDGFFVVPLIEPAWTDVSIPTGDLPEPSEVLSPDPYRAEAVMLTIDRLSHGGLIAGSGDEGQLVYGYDGDTFWVRREEPTGAQYFAEEIVQYTPHDRPVALALRHLDGRWWAMKEGVLLQPLPGIEQLDGRVGFAHISSGPEPERFLSLRVTERPADLDWGRAVRIDVPRLDAVAALEK
jgi:hypothetical protein